MRKLTTFLLTLAAPLLLLALSPGGSLHAVQQKEVSNEETTLARDEPGDRAVVDVQVTEAVSRRRLPSRLTLVNKRGEVIRLSPLPGQRLAVRPGVIYTPDGRARFTLPPGDYRLYASRGPLYNLHAQQIRLRPGVMRRIKIQLRREVAAPGLISADTHIHTLTYSGHGDATLDERAITLAGEGIEMPVATEHDRLGEYSAALGRTGVRKHLTPVLGAEITTPKGHFNIFPVNPGSALPDRRIEDWPELMKAIRRTPGVQVIVLNHPRDVHSGFRPFDPAHFNSVTGENLRGEPFAFDALEVLNSSAQQADFMRPYHDWFALLNYGHRVVAVGSSDSHDVNQYIVGQGRTYIAYGDDTGPAEIDIARACRKLLEGRATVSLGLLTNLTVNDRYGVGDLARVTGKSIRVRITVQAPSWIEADRVELFANGAKIREQKIRLSAGSPRKLEINWTFRRPGHDVHLVAIASGPGITAAYWPLAPPYQPASTAWVPRMIGSTNPIWVDADGDGVFTPARAYAASLVKRASGRATTLLPELAAYDQAVAAQAASLFRAVGYELQDAAFQRSLMTAAPQVRAGFSAYLEALAGAAPKR